MLKLLLFLKADLREGEFFLNVDSIVAQWMAYKKNSEAFIPDDFNDNLMLDVERFSKEIKHDDAALIPTKNILKLFLKLKHLPINEVCNYGVTYLQIPFNIINELCDWIKEKCHNLTLV